MPIIRTRDHEYYHQRRLRGVAVECAWVMDGVNLILNRPSRSRLHGGNPTTGQHGYRVGLRTQEIGVRMALGAGRGAIFREVVLHGLTIAVAGIVIGEILAIPAVRALGSVQTSIRPAPVSAHFAAAVIWIAIAFVACYLPASRRRERPIVRAAPRRRA